MMQRLFQHQQPEIHIRLRRDVLIGVILHLFTIVQEQQHQHAHQPRHYLHMHIIGVAELTTITSYADNCINPRFAKRGFVNRVV